MKKMNLHLYGKLILIPILILLICTGVAKSAPAKYLLGIKGGYSTLTGGETGKFPLQISYGFYAGYRPSTKWTFFFDYSQLNLKNDTLATSSFSFAREDSRADRKWIAKRVCFGVIHPFMQLGGVIDLNMGFNAGMMNWKMVNPTTDYLLESIGGRNQRVDFDASELFIGAIGGVTFKLSEKVNFNSTLNLDYLTGAGAEFSDSVISVRDKMVYSFSVSLSIGIGSLTKDKFSQWTPEYSKPIKKKDSADSDEDGVSDKDDKCINTPPGATVDKNGCPVDSDGDGVFDGRDDCPNTDRKASGKVDIHGCPIDRDFDGIPDYLDNCQDNQVGAWVDNNGCPIDSDADGVPDGLDDCPYTLVGVDVDRNGCLDLSMFSKPMVLNIQYVSGSYEIDFNTKEKLKQLARLLNFVKDVKLDINGYTDNIGTTKANRDISLKRANRVRDYLVLQGVSSDRIKPFGKGETNFVASNNVASGREKNRRVEIIFYK